SALLLYRPVTLYWISATSERTQKPRAKPAGAHTWRLFSAETSIPNHFPRVGEPVLISTATRKALPRVTRINLPIGGSHWKCKPRTTPWADREWLSWTKCEGKPSALNWSSR